MSDAFSPSRDQLGLFNVPESPAAKVGRESPSLAPMSTASEQAAEQDRRERIPIIHELAAVPRSFLTEVEYADLSEQAGSSRNDSGYWSHKSAYNTLEDTGDTASIYSVDSISTESRKRYIATFSSRLTQDICKLPSFPAISMGTRDQLVEWVKTFSLKLQVESPTRNGRHASVFIRRYRKDIVHELDGFALGETTGEEEEGTEPRTPSRKSDNDICKWAGAIEASEDLEISSLSSEDEDNLETSSLASEDEDDLDLPNLEEYERFIPESQAYKWLLSRIDSHAQLDAQGENCLTNIGDYIRGQVMLQKPFRGASRQEGPPVVQILFYLDWDIESFGRSQEFALPLSQVLDHVICLTGTWKQAQAMTVAEYMTQTWPSTNEPIRALVKKRLDDPSARTVHCELPHGYRPSLCK